MRTMIIVIILWVIILIFNTLYSFLPTNIQNLKWIKIFAVIVALIILIGGINQAVKEFREYRFADIGSKDGRILKKRNFPWKVTKTKHDGDIIYVINERYGDATDISLKMKKSITQFSIYNAIDGVAVKFSCKEAEIPDFRIIIK